MYLCFFNLKKINYFFIQYNYFPENNQYKHAIIIYYNIDLIRKFICFICNLILISLFLNFTSSYSFHFLFFVNNSHHSVIILGYNLSSNF